MDKQNCHIQNPHESKKVRYPENLKYKDLLDTGDQKKVASEAGISIYHLNKILNGHRRIQDYLLDILEQYGDINRLKHRYTKLTRRKASP